MSGNYRHRVHSKGATKIPKHYSSSSNPTKNRHRQAALSARNASCGGTFLAVEDRPPVTDEMLSALPLESMDIGGSSSKSMISEGGISKISEFTACTNPTFHSVNHPQVFYHAVLLYCIQNSSKTDWFRSGSSIQAEVVSVLAAIAELIKERNGKESDVEYFAALLTALEGSILGNSKRTAAIAYLLHLIVRKVPKEVLQSQFNRSVQILYTKLLENDSQDGTALKNLISVLGIVLRAQPPAAWNSASTRNILVSVASMCAHEKPWVRTMARRVLRAVLTDPVTATDNGLHPVSGALGNFIVQHVDSFLNKKGESATIVRYLCLLEGIMHKLPSSLFKKLAEGLLKCFSLSDPMVKCSALQCLHRSLQRQPCDSALPIETNAQLLIALRQLNPSSSDITVTAYWLQALSEAHVCLTAKDSTKSIQLLHQSLALIVGHFESGNEQLAQVTYQVLTRLIENCVKDDSECGKSLLSLLDKAITMKSASVWKFILRTEMKLYEVCGEALQGKELKNALQSLGRLRQDQDCFCRPELDFTIGSAVRHVGVAPVLSAIPLEVDPDSAVMSTEFSRSWLLPILRVNIHNAPIALFASHFLPIAMKIYRRLSSLDAVTQRIYTTYQFQLWELLPAFCESPSDLETVFPDLAPILGAALRERKDLRMTVLGALRRCLRFSLQPDAPAERVEVMSRFAKNFMPILFNMYTASAVDGEYDDKGVRLSVLETIRAYAEVAPNDLLENFVDSALAKSKEENDKTPTSMQKQSRVLDILCALTISVDVGALEKILDSIRLWFDSLSVYGYQKKAYRILEEVLQRRSSQDVEELISSYTDYIENVICSCVHMLLDKFDSLASINLFLKNVLSNIILLLDKENNTHTRQNASKCLQFISNKLIELGGEESESPSNALNTILSHIFEMTTPVPSEEDISLNVVRSCLVALNIIVQKQIKVLNATLTSQIISQACTWISEGRAPIRILAIRLVRVLVQKLPEYALQQYKEQLMSTIFEGQLTSDLTVKVRKANRLLLEILVEKFGNGVVGKYAKKPDWAKQLRNIEKLRRRKERKEAGQTEKDSDDDEQSAISGVSGRTAGADTILELLQDSDEDNDKSDAEEEMQRRSQVGSVWLRDDADGEVMDLLDSTQLVNKVTTTNPALLEKKKKKAQERKEKNESGFKFTKDGKLIILDDEVEEKKKSRKRKNLLDDLEDEEGGQEKRAKEDSDLESDDYDEDDVDVKTAVSRATTKPSFGGKGIFRDTSSGSQVAPSASGAKRKHQEQRNKQKAVSHVQPYAYVPLRDKAARQNVRNILKAKKKGGKNKKN